jgi:hypothetical protein
MMRGDKEIEIVEVGQASPRDQEAGTCGKSQCKQAQVGTHRGGLGNNIYIYIIIPATYEDER